MRSDDIESSLYEAALVPELWPDVLEDFSAHVGGSCGGFAFFGETGEHLIGTRRNREAGDDIVANVSMRGSSRMETLLGLKHRGFLRDIDYLSEDEIRNDPVTPVLMRHNLSCMAETFFNLPGNDLIFFAMSREHTQNRASRKQIGRLNALRPHLARAAAISSRIVADRMKAAVSLLETLGMPAAILTEKGRVLAANGQMEAMESIRLDGAFGRIAMAGADTSRRFSIALEGLRREASMAGGARLPGVDADGDRNLHLVPISGHARSLFPGGEFLLVASQVQRKVELLRPELLIEFFRLTPAEAATAIALMEGLSLAQAADRLDVTMHTSRSHLRQIFAKTGTHRQSELVALLGRVAARSD